MDNEFTMDNKVYLNDKGRAYSIRDLLNYFVQHGSMRVSDLHLKAGCPPAFRVDGLLQTLPGPGLEPHTIEALARPLLSDQDLETLEKERSVDTSYITDELQFRINCFHDTDGPAVAIRALEPSPPPVEEIGFPNKVWQDIIERRSGLVLLTGITGCGKSTTIASMIDRIAATRGCRIITLEDPIEYRLKSRAGIISQREVGRDVIDFEQGLRAALREDPDVIFVGEMRDIPSTTWTLTAAETGHLVFSTLHSRNARGTITRILDMYPPSRQNEVASQLSLGLAYVISQKLIPRIDGKGRAVAMEILNNTYGVANLIRTKKLEQLYTQQQTRVKDIPDERMCTMEHSLARQALAGIISPQEAEKWAEDPASFMDEMQRNQ